MPKLRWHKPRSWQGKNDPPVWWADLDDQPGVSVAEVVKTGRDGADHYPWDWYLTTHGAMRFPKSRRQSGVEESLKVCKTSVATAIGL